MSFSISVGMVCGPVALLGSKEFIIQIISVESADSKRISDLADY